MTRGIGTKTFGIAKSILTPIVQLAQTMKQRGGTLHEVWVSRVIYDDLSFEIKRRSLLHECDDAKWKNGLIVIKMGDVKIKVRVDE